MYGPVEKARRDEWAPRTSGARSASRLTGIDIARGIAVIGMYAAHVGPRPDSGGFGLFTVFNGRSAALFAVLAGVSLALMSGGREPRTGLAAAHVAMRVATRAPLLILLGLGLVALNTGYMNILAYYGICFALVFPWLRCGFRPLAIAAALFVTLSPALSFVARFLIAPREVTDPVPDVSLELFTSLGGFTQAIVILVLTGAFPAVNLLGYVLAGMAIGRLDLRSPGVRRGLIAGGAGMAVTAYSLSWVATQVLGGRQLIYEDLRSPAAAAGMSPEQFFDANYANLFGTTPTTSPAWQLLSTSHAYTSFDLLGCLGVAAAVLGVCLHLGDRFSRPLRPLADLGSLVLTAYIGHFLAIRLLEPEPGTFAWLAFVAVALVAAVAWRRLLGRGPFEWLLHVVSGWPVRIANSARK
ncbi:heparan-alpha-glucosaminide N-acetyltransferase domain-containing protein [Amycolatopsis palatopharyngis]|uniref:heparan-alpha-glucosaminide N-acetyltransferase domain-containing protein n=1 Tax=Amycolatopsis palatopharyngis TaxID=187982 RepID=UPI001FEB02BE|nr:heparan-alpha-glucosaminide N-acetyltransferase domain-containing protein [Amycolatopsis palatopharyngis]